MLVRTSLFFFALTLSLNAQQPDLTSAIKAATHPLTLSPTGDMTGEGAVLLRDAVHTARYVLLGEEHMSREIPAFAAGVCSMMAADGLNAMVFESSHGVAAFVEEDLRSPAGREHMRQQIRRYPESVAFLDSVPEFDLAAKCATVSGRKDFRLIGVDQEFFGASGWLLQQMLDSRPGPASRIALLRMQQDEAKGAAAADVSGDPSKLLMMSATEEQLKTVSAAVEKDGTARTRALFHEFTESRQIYLENFKGDPDSNVRRALLLRHNFIEGVKALPPSSRVLIKMGGWHLYKGMNPLHNRDLGNYIAERADGEGSKSLHLLVIGQRGSHASFAGYNKPRSKESFDLTKDKDTAWLKPVFDALPTVGGPQWKVVDLRTLRWKRRLALDRDMEQMVYGYDLLVIIPELTPAEFIH